MLGVVRCFWLFSSPFFSLWSHSSHHDSVLLGPPSLLTVLSSAYIGPALFPASISRQTCKMFVSPQETCLSVHWLPDAPNRGSGSLPKDSRKHDPSCFSSRKDLFSLSSSPPPWCSRGLSTFMQGLPFVTHMVCILEWAPRKLLMLDTQETKAT